MNKHNGELEIDEDAPFEKRFWTVQRIGWLIMLLVILAAMFGFTGRGGLSGINKIKKASQSQSLVLEYDRFQRYQVSDKLTVKLQQLQTTAPTITFSKVFYEKIRVEQVVPQPEKVEINANEITYTFSISQPSGDVIFYTKPMHAGSLEVMVKGPNNERVPISMFVYP
ncbi:hypothetical protein [Pontibacter fetidus]|uniref:Uncharacterized protein n=1 Tax=Pontibacter fetidus TaxID=2700082 RepID=A0A6B2H1P2_9BACT|nr:hypothetical protein [Pontibacter fetidus]NDK56233.1 hypothetical protein [Pontibacter fetidus]